MVNGMGVRLKQRAVIEFLPAERISPTDKNRSGRPVTVTDVTHQEAVDKVIRENRPITQKEISPQLGTSTERVWFIIRELQKYRKVRKMGPKDADR